jgi:hypothetical protein
MDAARPFVAPCGPAGRIRRGASRALTVGVLVPAVALSLAGPALADVSAVSGSATGIAANTTGLLAVNVIGQPTVSLPASGGGPLTGTLASVNAAPLLSTGELNVSTEGSTGPGGSVTSSASVDDTALVGLLNANLLTATAISSECTSDESGSTGSTTIAGLTALGSPITVTGSPNQTVNVAGLGTLFINEQIPTGSAPSSSITVNALRLQLNILGVVAGSVTIAQSVCGVTGDGVGVPAGAIGGVLLAGLVAIGFVGYQVTRRRRRPGTART